MFQSVPSYKVCDVAPFLKLSLFWGLVIFFLWQGKQAGMNSKFCVCHLEEQRIDAISENPVNTKHDPFTAFECLVATLKILLEFSIFILLKMVVCV